MNDELTPTMAQLASELDFWTRMDNELIKAEHIYDNHIYDILTIRRRISTIRIDIIDVMRWRKYDEEKERETKDAAATES